MAILRSNENVMFIRLILFELLGAKKLKSFENKSLLYT